MHPTPPPGFHIFEEYDGPFGELVGPLFATRPPDSLRFAFLPQKHHTNGGGNMHGGMLMMLADQILGMTVRKAIDGARSVTLNLDCDFVASARPGEWLEGEAEIIRQTRSMVFVRGSIRCGENIVLSISGIWKKLNQPRP